MRTPKPLINRTQKASRLGNAADLAEDDDVVVGKNNAVGYKKKTGGLQGVEFGGQPTGKLGKMSGPPKARAKGVRNKPLPNLPGGSNRTVPEDENDPRARKRKALLRRLKGGTNFAGPGA